MNRYLDCHQMVIPPSNEMSTPFVDPLKVSQLNELLNENGNNKCADCGMQLTIETAWADLSYGIFVCDDCKLVHIEEDRQFLAQTPGGNSSPGGFLPTNLYQHWNESDINQMKNNGNNKVNQKYLSNMPVWQYMPTGNDGIKHKEYWIKYKYGSPHTAAHDMPKTANKSFLGIQFTRPTPSEGNYPCCAVLQNDKLYLTSSVKNDEEIEIEDIETVLLNSKRIGHENGVQLTYRVKNPDKSVQCDDVMYTYLQHDNMKVVLDWINLVLYHKYNICKNKYRGQGEANLSKMLNCEMLKEGYIPTPNHQFIYASLSEARIACFKHHLDDKPLLQMPVTKSTNLKPYQYLESIAYFFGMATDSTKILGYDDWMAAFEKTMAIDKLACLPEGVVKTTIPKKLLAPRQEIKPAPVEDKKVEAAPKFTLEPEKLRNSNSPVEQEKLTNGSVKSALSCYPPIGPMGEMGKVARGELPPEAIKPPPPKNDLNRMQLYGDFKPGMDPIRTSAPSPIDPVVNSMAMSGQMTQQSIPKSLQNCYPPIKGPMRDTGLRTLHESNSFDSFSINNNISENDYVIDEYKGTISSNYNQMGGRVMQNNSGFTHKSRTYSEAELMQYAALNQSDWPGERNILTVPWKESRNGQFEPNHSFNSQFDTWNNNTMQDKRNKMSGQMFQGGSYRHEMQQQQQLGRSASWNPSPGQSMEQWGSKQPTGDRFFSGLPSGKITRPAASSNQQVVMDHLHKYWVQAEAKLRVLINNGYVPAANMTVAGLDPNSGEHAATCITELFELLWKRQYDLALSFLRGFREVFSQSRDIEIRKKFIGVGELDTMNQIFMQQGREKFLSANSGGPVTWKQPCASPQTVEPHNQSWPTSITARDSPTSFTSPWGAISPTTPVSESVWGPSRTLDRSQSNSLDRDPWGISTTTQKTTGNFNRAPSRPISLTRSSFSENSPTEGSFGSKASSSSSASPRVITPPAGLDIGQTSTGSLGGIESTLKHLFLSYPSGSTSWDS